MAFDGSVLDDDDDVWDFAQVFAGGFERPREGRNAVGGFCTLPALMGGHRVFVRFLKQRDAICAALVDTVKPLFGRPSNGCCVVRVRMPPQGADIPWARNKDAVKKARGLEWALVTREIAGCTVTQHLVSLSSSPASLVLSRKSEVYRELRLPRDEALLRELVKTLAFRLVVGVADMGLSNFIYDSAANQLYSIDEGGAFCETNDPRVNGGARRLLTHNLLCKEVKQLAVQLGLHVVNVSEMLGVDFSPERVQAICAQFTHLLSARRYLEHEPSLAELVEGYVRPNIDSLQHSLQILLTSESSGKRCRAALEAALPSPSSSPSPCLSRTPTKKTAFHDGALSVGDVTLPNGNDDDKEQEQPLAKVLATELTRAMGPEQGRVILPLADVFASFVRQ